MSDNLYFLPSSLQALGFVGRLSGGVEIIIPPVCAISVGPFLMGSDKSRDSLARPDEMPQHSVDVAAFHIAKYPVTVAEYACAVRANVVLAPKASSDTFEDEQWHNQLRHPDHPVQKVFSTDAFIYAAWLAAMTGVAWRLPTETEWEKAARGTDGRIFPWGDEDDNTRANAGSVGHFFFEGEGKTSGPGMTTRVGSYPAGASPYGIQDTAGNVWEWCSSHFAPYPYDSRDGREDQQAQGLPVLRGGSYFDHIWFARTAQRGRLETTSGIFGFRLAYSS